MATSRRRPNVTNVRTVVRKAWNEFWAKTNISGICNARTSNSESRRNFWIVIFALFIILTFTGLRNVIDEITNYPVITLLTVKNQNQVCDIIVIFLLIQLSLLRMYSYNYRSRYITIFLSISD